MSFNKKILFSLFILLISLFVRETPYLNVLVVGKIWFIYPLLTLFLFLPLKINYLIFLTFSLLFLSALLIFFKLVIFDEALGILIYFLLVGVVILKINLLKKELKDL